jgi:hypothetical protein
MMPTYTLKKGVRYRHYLSHAFAHMRKNEAGSVRRVPAQEVEGKSSKRFDR